MGKIKLTNKFKLSIIIAWFVVFYLIMWFVGGACTNIFSGGACVSSEAISGLRGVPILGLIVPFNAWISIMYFFAPIAGIVLGYFAIKWYNEYFETKQASSALFVLVILIALFTGYLINLTWYYGNLAQLNDSSTVNVELYFCFDEANCNQIVSSLNTELQQTPSADGRITQLLSVNYWPELRESIYLTFLLGALAAWLPLFAFNLIEKKS